MYMSHKMVWMHVSMTWAKSIQNSHYNKKLRTSDFIGPHEIFYGDSSPVKVNPLRSSLPFPVLSWFFVQASPWGSAKKAQNNIWGQI